MRKRKIAFLLSFLLLLGVPGISVAAADGSSYVYDGYTYDYWGNALESPAAFELETVIDRSDMGSIKLQSVDDVCTSADGRIFLTDKTESRVNVFDSTGKFLKSIKVIMNEEKKIVLDADGNQIVLTNPSGTYYHDKNDELYIADTGAKRIVVLDGQGYTMKRIINEPEDLSGVTEFKPSKVAVDQADRIYIVVQSSYEGIIELNADGTFSRYFGVNEPEVNLIDYFWKSLASDTQKEKMGKTYAPAFNNVTMDSEGFVYAVTHDSTAADMVFRLNSAGENVLRETGKWRVIGDIFHDNDPSKFVDVAVTEYGVYAALDMTMGRIYLYNYDGELLNVFGSLGNLKGQFKTPSGIAWNGYSLVVSDSELKCAYILKPTEFGDVLLRGSEKYYFGKWDEAVELFEEALRHNANLEVAYVGIGKNYLMKDEYELAMKYFELGNSREYYSKAYNGYRTIQIEKHFGIIAVIFVALIVMLVVSEVRYHKKGGKQS
ncbi:MAG: hypothetical protein IJY09_11055 [Lachnospiraceae bacterium]|nr:hypothetical protein [Lachnospiraceae bacterium]